MHAKSTMWSISRKRQGEHSSLPVILQQDRRWGSAGQHQSVTCGLYLAMQRAGGGKLRFFMTNSPHRAMPADQGLLFIAVFDKWGGECLFPVPFVTEWW